MIRVNLKKFKKIKFKEKILIKLKKNGSSRQMFNIDMKFKTI